MARRFRQAALALVWMVCLGWLACIAAPAAAVTLTAEERAWLAANNPVMVGVGPSTRYPMAYYTVQLPPNAAPDAEPIVTGYSAEMLALVAERTGMKFRYVSVPDVPTGVAMMQAGRIHMTPLLRMTPERRSILTMPEVTAGVGLVWVVRSDMPDMEGLHRRGDLRAAVPPGTPLEAVVRQAFPQVQIHGVVAEVAGIAEVAGGRADITLVDLHSAIQTIERLRLPGLQIRRLPQVQQFEAGPVVAIQFPLLHSIVAKALASISPAEREVLARRWLPAGVGTAFGTQTALLGPQEVAWIERQPRLRAAADAQLPPLSQSAAGGGAARDRAVASDEVSGLAADVLRQVALKVGLQIGSVRGVIADELPQLARTGEIDIAVGLPRTPANEAAFTLVGPYLRTSTVIAMAVGAPEAVTELRDLGPGAVAVVRSEAVLPELQSRFPALRILSFDHLEQALQAVARGQAQAAIGNAFAINHLIQHRHAGRLHVTGVVRDGEIDLYFGVPRSNPELARVLALGFEALTPSDMAELRQRWLLLRIDQGLQWGEVLRWALPVAAAALAVLVVLLLANRRLRAARQAAELARAEAEAANAARGRFLAYLAHEVRGLVHGIGWGARLMLTRQPQASPEQIARWIRSSAESTGRLLESTLENERALAHGVTLTPAPQDLAAWWQATLAPHELVAAAKGLTLQVHPPSAPEPLHFDALRLAQVVHNLVGNAVKFTERGEVVVRGRWDALSQQLHVEVKDSGPGIGPDELALLWQPYTQGAAGRDAGGGAGLGLAITRQIVSAMGGSVQADSSLPCGSRFWFQVPMRSDPSGGVRPA